MQLPFEPLDLLLQSKLSRCRLSQVILRNLE